jgi:hypothetical protein
MNDIQEQLGRIVPVTDDEAARLARPGTLADLAAGIIATSAGTAAPASQGRRTAAGRRSPGRRGRIRRRWIIGAPLAAGLAAAVLIITSLGHPGQHVGPVSVAPAPAQAQALSFTRHGGFIDVIVRDPLADPARYRAEFARYHLDITLKLLPVSPSIVGTVVYFGQSAHSGTLTPITAQGKCLEASGTSACPVGIRIPVGFRGNAQLVFGRAARPGEQYESTASAFAPGEALHGLSVRGLRVTQVLALLRHRHVTVAWFDVLTYGEATNERHVPGSYFVSDANPWSLGKVQLFVSKAWPPPGAPSGTPSGQPAATPSPTGQPAATPSPTPSG